MIVIPERQLVLLLPWKCASQTLRARLRAHDALSHPAFFHVNEALGRISHQHLTLASFRALPESARGYRIAVFVRNPYDRVCSGFTQLRRDVVWQRHAAFPGEAVKATVMRQLDDIAITLGEARGSASRWFARLPEQVVLCDGFNTSIPLHPCHYWTHEEGHAGSGFYRPRGTVRNRLPAALPGIRSAGRDAGQQQCLEAAGSSRARPVPPCREAGRLGSGAHQQALRRGFRLLRLPGDRAPGRRQRLTAGQGPCSILQCPKHAPRSACPPANSVTTSPSSPRP